MNPRPLVLDVEVARAVQDLIEYASTHRVSFERLARMAEADEPPIGDDPHHVLLIPYGFRCVFGIEEQRPPLGWCRHLSVSVAEPGALPSLPAFGAIATLFGFRFTGAGQAPPDWPGTLWIEKPESHDDLPAVNLLEQMEPL